MSRELRYAGRTADGGQVGDEDGIVVRRRGSDGLLVAGAGGCGEASAGALRDETREQTALTRVGVHDEDADRL